MNEEKVITVADGFKGIVFLGIIALFVNWTITGVDDFFWLQTNSDINDYSNYHAGQVYEHMFLAFPFMLLVMAVCAILIFIILVIISLIIKAIKDVPIWRLK